MEYTKTGYVPSTVNPALRISKGAPTELAVKEEETIKMFWAPRVFRWVNYTAVVELVIPSTVNPGEEVTTF